MKIRKKIIKILLLFSLVLATIFTIGIYICLKKYPQYVEYPHLIPYAWTIPYSIEECGGENFNQKVLDGINKIRVQTKKRYKVFSGYRDKETNKKANGVTNSQHLKGNAVDLWVPLNDRSEFYEAAKSAGFTAYGWGNRSVHIDIGRRRWWTYDIKGNPVGGKRKCEFIDKAPDNFKKDFKTCR